MDEDLRPRPRQRSDRRLARRAQHRATEAVEVVGIRPSAPFHKAMASTCRAPLPRAAFHLVKLANDTVTVVRQRVTQQVTERRRRPIKPVLGEPAAAGARRDDLSAGGWAKLATTLRG